MKIKVNPYSLASIKDSVRELRRYSSTIETRTKQLIEKLTDAGFLKARELVPIYTGEALNDITAYIEDGKGVIKAGGYCAFIEFGTGTKGEQGPDYPAPEFMAAMSWIYKGYNTGPTIFTTKDGRKGWYYPADDGTWRFTEGMPSRPFMWETIQYLKSEYKRIAREVFNGQGQV